YIIPLSNLTRLTDLTLINFDLVQTLTCDCSLASVTSLTICSGQLLTTFYEPSAERPSRRRFAVELFRLTLLAQFPKLQSLTLVDSMRQHQLACEQLRVQLGPRLVRLFLFIERYVRRRI